MAYPTKPVKSTSYTAHEQEQGNGWLPGQELDVDLLNYKSSIDQTINFVKGFTRSDGKLANRSVGRDQLTPDAQVPALLSSTGYTWPIFAFGGAEAERAKDTSVADYQAIITSALQTGEKIFFPKWEYPIRSKASSTRGVSVDADVPINVECAAGAKFIVGSVFAGVSGALFRLKAATEPTSHTVDLLPFSWVGGEFNGEQITADEGMGSGSGLSFMDLSWWTFPVVERVRFLGGFTTPSGSNPGFGYIDTAIDTHGIVSGRFRDCLFMGMYDVGIYASGTRDTRTLASSPFEFTDTSPTVTVTATAHGLVVGAYVWFRGATAAAGLTIFGQYLVASVTTDTFTITAADDATSTTTGGGSAVMLTTELSDLIASSLAGSDLEIAGCRFYRNSVAVASKRNQIGINAHDNVLFRNSTGFASAEIDEPNSYGKGWTITNNRIEKTQGFPITLTGGHGDVVANNLILDWGKLINTPTDFTPVGVGSRIGAITLRSCRAPHVNHNTIVQRLSWAEGTPEADKEPVGIQLRADAELAWIQGTRRADVSFNEIDGAYYSILESSESDTGNNRFHSNGEQNVGAVRVLRPTSYLTMPFGGIVFTPVINTTTGSVTHDVSTGEYWISANLFEAYGYCDLASITTPGGVVRITGFPYANEFDWPVAVALTTNNLALSAGHSEHVGQVLSGETAITLYEKHGTTGVLTSLPVSALGANTRISFSATYRIAP